MQNSARCNRDRQRRGCSAGLSNGKNFRSRCRAVSRFREIPGLPRGTGNGERKIIRRQTTAFIRRDNCRKGTENPFRVFGTLFSYSCSVSALRYIPEFFRTACSAALPQIRLSRPQIRPRRRSRLRQCLYQRFRPQLYQRLRPMIHRQLCCSTGIVRGFIRNCTAVRDDNFVAQKSDMTRKRHDP